MKFNHWFILSCLAALALSVYFFFTGNQSSSAATDYQRTSLKFAYNYFVLSQALKVNMDHLDKTTMVEVIENEDSTYANKRNLFNEKALEMVGSSENVRNLFGSILNELSVFSKNGQVEPFSKNESIVNGLERVKFFETLLSTEKKLSAVLGSEKDTIFSQYRAEFILPKEEGKATQDQLQDFVKKCNNEELLLFFKILENRFVMLEQALMYELRKKSGLAS